MVRSISSVVASEAKPSRLTRTTRFGKALRVFALSAFFIFWHSTLFAESVKAVIDGDTLLLEDGRFVRLIGIDAPELGHRGAPSQPFARKAKAHLLGLVRASGWKVLLEPGMVPKDHYGRALAHVFDRKGDSLAIGQLEQGLATLMVFPPNVRDVGLLKDAQALARREARGLWASQLKAPLNTVSQAGLSDGVQWVEGRILSIRRSRSAVFIELGGLLLKSTATEWKTFEIREPVLKVGSPLSVLGKVYHYKGKARMRLRHPAQLIE